MQKHFIDARPDWREKLASCGIGFAHTPSGARWNENVCYELTHVEADILYEQTRALYEKMIQVTDTLIESEHLSPIDLPVSEIAAITRSWEASDYLPTLFTRFDFAWNGSGLPQLIGIEAECPHLLLESALGQWRWVSETIPWATQFNTIEERLSGCWREYGCIGRKVHFGFAPGEVEHYLIADYLREVAFDTGVKAVLVPYDQITLGDGGNDLLDSQNQPIELLVNVSPFSHLAGLDRIALANHPTLCTTEPLWKKLWQTEAWRRYFTAKTGLSVGHIYQENLRSIGPKPPYCSVWVIGGTVSGLAIREHMLIESRQELCFIPHLLT